MTDITDDIAEEISFQSFDDDCRLLGNLLNDILQREVGTNLVDKLERIRVLAQVKKKNQKQKPVQERSTLQMNCETNSKLGRKRSNSSSQSR